MERFFLTLLGSLIIHFALGQEEAHVRSQKRQISAALAPLEKDVAELYQKVLPTVVTLYTQSTVVSSLGTNSRDGLGSGVLVSKECHILTAAHVVRGATEILVKTQDGQLRRATVLFGEPAADIALLKLDRPDTSLPHAQLGDSDILAVGQNIYAIGSPYGMENSFSSGIISAFRGFDRIYDGSVKIEFIQTDAALNSGNSGGPLFNSKGEVVGIASSILTVSGGFQGIGMAVSINTAKNVLSFENRPWLGIDGVLLQEGTFAQIFNRQLPGGILVQSVAVGSPAERAGLRGGFIPTEIAGQQLLLGGDIVLAFDQHRACHIECLEANQHKMAGKDTIVIQFLRGGKTHRVAIDVSKSRKNFLITE